MFERAHYAASTQKTRSSQVGAYLDFCETFEDRLDPYPCGEEQVCLYMTYLARRLCYSSITNYLSALNNHLKDLECPAINYESHKIKKCMAGIRRLKGDATKQAAPLLPPGLLRLFGMLQQTRGHTAVRAAMLLSFRALLRKGHVTASDNTLERKDITFHPWGLMVNITKSKTIQFNEKVHRIPVAKVTNRALCAAYWVEQHFRECPAPMGAQAFRMPRVGHSVPLTYSFYLQVIKLLCARAGMDPTKFSTHSLRRGGANFLRLCGAPIEVIKERGDWKSDAVYLYLEASLAERLTTDMRVAMILDHLA